MQSHPPSPICLDCVYGRERGRDLAACSLAIATEEPIPPQCNPVHMQGNRPYLSLY